MPASPRRPLPAPDPGSQVDGLFALLPSHRDRALVAFWVSTGARASELLGATVGDADPGQQLISVIRKGSRVMQQLPASADAFVWLRLYQAQMQGLVPRLVEIRDNLIARIAEAKREGWLGEVEGVEVHLAGAEQKLSQIDQIVSRRTVFDLGIPTFAEVAGRATG